MALSQAGDAQAHEAVLVACQLWLRRFFAGKIGPEHAEELVQETLLAVHNKRASYDPGRPFLPWLAAIARYRWVDRLRAIYRHQSDVHAEQVEAIDAGETVVAKLSLDRLMAQLSDGQRAAITLVKIDGLSVADAAVASGQSVSLVKMNIHRGLRRLSVLVEED
jgi:RNA polymerase sigma-70 factor (ECF subfamily)